MKYPMNKKIFITGGAGYVGVALGNYLSAEGYGVIATDIKPRPKELAKKIKFIKLDIVHDNFEKHLRNIDTVFHAAAVIDLQESWQNPKKYHDINVSGTVNLLEAARKAKVLRVVFSSSMSAYLPDNPYSLTKLIGEEYMKLYANCKDLETVSLRYFNFYGPKCRTSVVNNFILQTEQGKPLTVFGGNDRRFFLYIDDLVLANIAAMKSKKVGKGEVIDIAGGKPYRIIDLAKMISKDVKVKKKLAKDNIAQIKPNLKLA